MRSATGTKFGPAGSVVARTKSVMAFLAAPSFQDGSGPDCANAGPCQPASAAAAIRALSTARRFVRIFPLLQFHGCQADDDAAARKPGSHVTGRRSLIPFLASVQSTRLVVVELPRFFRHLQTRQKIGVARQCT